MRYLFILFLLTGTCLAESRNDLIPFNYTDLDIYGEKVLLDQSDKLVIQAPSVINPGLTNFFDGSWYAYESMGSYSSDWAEWRRLRFSREEAKADGKDFELMLRCTLWSSEQASVFIKWGDFFLATRASILDADHVRNDQGEKVTAQQKSQALAILAYAAKVRYLSALNVLMEARKLEDTTLDFQRELMRRKEVAMIALKKLKAVKANLKAYSPPKDKYL